MQARSRFRYAGPPLQEDTGAPMPGAFIDQSLRDVHACAKCDIHPHGKLIEISERLWTSEEAQNLQLDASHVKMAPQSLRFCQNSMASRFQCGVPVETRRPRKADCHKLLACFHAVDGQLRSFALNNRTLFNALQNKAVLVSVKVVAPPADWERRFSGQKPWLCM